MRTWRWYSKLLLGLLLLAFAYWVWPTPYRYWRDGFMVSRMDRLRGMVQDWSGGWQDRP
jgi:hypothetical protein